MSGSSTEVCRLMASSKMSGERFSRMLLMFRLMFPLGPFMLISTATVVGSKTMPFTSVTPADCWREALLPKI